MFLCFSQFSKFFKINMIQQDMFNFMLVSKKTFFLIYLKEPGSNFLKVLPTADLIGHFAQNSLFFYYYFWPEALRGLFFGPNYIYWLNLA